MICASGHTHASRFEAEKCDGLGYAQAKDDIEKLRRDLEHAKVDRDCCCAGTEELRKKLEVANLQIHELQEIVKLCVCQGGLNFHDEGGKCPEDDTCDCPDAKRVNAAMEGFVEKRKDEAPQVCDMQARDGSCYCTLLEGHDGDHRSVGETWDNQWKRD